MEHLTSLETFVSFLFSLYMGKKCIFLGRSDSVSCIETHKRLMSREPEIDNEFKSFVVEEVARLFKNFHYRVNNLHVPPPTSYCLKGEDFNLHNFLLDRSVGRQQFVDFWQEDKLEGDLADLVVDFESTAATHNVKVIRDKGKTRVITTNHPATFAMKNFQWSVHNHLKHNPIFFYIGKQVRTHVEVLPRAKDEWVLSGDYENSTDFIPSEMTRIIYDVILSKIKGRPNLKKLVRHSLEKEILVYPDGEEIEMRSGQLMGGLLSFPALCIMNHCISKYLGINKKKVNGDDLLALTRIEKRREWVERSRSLGMAPNDSKSHFHPKYGTFNSQLIALKGNKLYHIPHFSITKLSGASLGDIMNTTSHLENDPMCVQFGTVWMENHSHHDLFNGSALTKPERLVLKDYDNFFYYQYNECLSLFGSFIGKVGVFSLFYNKDQSIEEMIEKNWSTEYTDQKFAVGNGLICSLRDIWKGGDKDFFNYLKKNAKQRKNDTDPKVGTTDSLFGIEGEDLCSVGELA